MVSAPRQFASRFLGVVAHPGDFAEHRLESDRAFRALHPTDRRLAHELILGVLRWRSALDWMIARRTGGRRQEAVVQDLLRLGLYQLFWLDRLPDHAVVHDTVQLCRNAGLTRQAGFVNAASPMVGGSLARLTGGGVAAPPAGMEQYAASRLGPGEYAEDYVRGTGCPLEG